MLIIQPFSLLTRACVILLSRRARGLCNITTPKQLSPCQMKVDLLMESAKYIYIPPFLVEHITHRIARMPVRPNGWTCRERERERERETA